MMGKLVAAQIGTGYWGPNVANSFLATERVDLRWICDIDSGSLAALGARHPEARQTTDIDPILKDPEVDFVVIVTPTKTHYPIAKAVLQAGKHVLVEKPVTTDVAEAEELKDLAEKAGLVFMVGHVFQYNASIMVLKDMIENGELGEINYLSLTRTNLGPVRTDVNALWDLVSHDAYIMMDLLGSEPVAVSAMGHAYLNKDVEDVVFATFTFGSGAMAHVHASWLNPRKVRQITVVGSKKMAVWDDLDMEHPICVYEKRVEHPEPGTLEGSFLEYKTMVVDGGTTYPVIELNQPLLTQCEHFIDCVEKGTTPRSNGDVGTAVVRILSAAEISMQNQGALTPIT